MSTLRPFHTEPALPVKPAADLSPSSTKPVTGAQGTTAKPVADRVNLGGTPRGQIASLWHKATDLIPMTHANRNRAQIDPNILMSTSNFTNSARAVFAKVDANHDGTLSGKELIAAKAALPPSKPEAAAIPAMAATVSDIADLSDDENFMETKGLMREDLTEFGRLRQDAPLRVKAEGLYEAALPQTKQKPAGRTSLPVAPVTWFRSSGTSATGGVTSTAVGTKSTKPAPEPAAIPGVPLRARILSGAKTFWTNSTGKLPWVHENRNRAQIDPAAAAKAPDTAFTKQARTVFAKVDTNSNGQISRKELDVAMTSPTFQKLDAAAIGAMHKYAGDIEDLSKDERLLETSGITAKDLDQFDRLKTTSELHSHVEGTFSTARYKINKAERQLYAQGDKSVSGHAIEQGSLGDCYFLAAVAGVAATKPDDIRKMITANDDKTFTVQFPGRKPVTVTAPTDAEIGRYASSGKSGLWLTVLEKAYAKTRNSARVFAKGDDYRAIIGGFGKQGIKTLTGLSSSTSRITLMSTSQLVAQVNRATLEGRVMTISTGHPTGRSETKANQLPTGHEYTLLGYNAETGKFSIRNPWGSGGPMSDGIHELTAKEVKANFVRLTIQKKP
ncbi:MAG: hypothetical protein H7338_06955 [Candidatus Sericytochromatia bacterium]|nr:hypothetical protein [Candidatus Sericytochromatia bacterium]